MGNWIGKLFDVDGNEIKPPKKKAKDGCYWMPIVDQNGSVTWIEQEDYECEFKFVPPKDLNM